MNSRKKGEDNTSGKNMNKMKEEKNRTAKVLRVLRRDTSSLTLFLKEYTITPHDIVNIKSIIHARTHAHIDIAKKTKKK